MMQNLKCPSCRMEIGKGASSQTSGRIVWHGRFKHQVTYEELLQDEYQWACDLCLDNGKAIIADPAQQTFCDHEPYLAYFDQAKACPTCQQAYTFTKEEQQFWYEELKFWVQSKPTQCAKCRKASRHLKQLNKELSEILKDKAKLTIEQMARLIQIYNELNKPDKSKYYARMIEKFGKA